tara:strand:+ start:331 stop:531 length:201 start_codon:yes stop_codon:yes gene_type:complete
VVMVVRVFNFIQDSVIQQLQPHWVVLDPTANLIGSLVVAVVVDPKLVAVVMEVETADLMPVVEQVE